jgi:myosin heavy subunit
MTGMNFHYMNQGDLETTSIEGVEDSVRFQQTLEALELLGVGKSLTQEMLRILVGVLYLGEVRLSSRIISRHMFE